MADVWSQFPDAAPAADPWAQFPDVGASMPPALPGKGDALPMAAGAVPHEIAHVAAQPTPVGWGEDLLRSVGSGLVEGGEALVGLPGDIGNLVAAGGRATGRWLHDQINGPPARTLSSLITGSPAKPEPVIPSVFPSWLTLPGTADVAGAVSDVTGFQPHDPQSTAGKYGKTIASFVPASLIGPGGTLAKLAKFAVLPGAASETAGQITKGSKLEPYARTGAAIATGGVAALLSRPGTAAQALKASLPKGTTNADVDAAASLIADGQAKGIGLTWPEALAQVTDGRVDITDVQRVLEQMKGGRPVMSAFLSERPEQAKQAMAIEAGRIAPTTIDPVRAGLAIQNISKKAITNIRLRINQATGKYYAQGGSTRIPAADFARLSADPLFQQALTSVKTDPVFSRFLQGYPDDSVQTLDMVKKYFDDLAGAASTSGKNAAASVYGGVGRDVRDAATTASPAYDFALQRQAQLRQGVLTPAEEGPLGKMAGTSDLQRQGRILLPAKPLEGSEKVVGQTVRRLVRQDLPSALQLVRSHLTAAFDDATRNLIGGANQWGPAKFAAAIRGSAQQAKNLRTAIINLPRGVVTWSGLNRFLDVLEATGRRQHIGSPTEANRLLTGEMGRGGPIGTAASLAVSPGSAFTYVKDFYTSFRLGKNAEAIARMITDPRAADAFKALLNSRSVGDGQRVAALLIYYAMHPDQPAEKVAQPAQ